MRTRTRDKRRLSSNWVVAPVLACLALVMALIATTAAAAPIYTDWSAPVWLGPIVNSTASTLPLPRLEGRYGQTLALEGADVVAGGRATWRRGVPATLAPGSALIVAR